MIGRSLTLLMPDGERRAFRQQLAEMAYSRQTEIWEATMQSWHGISFRATLTTTTSYGSLGHPSMIRWIIQNMAAHAALAQPVERVRTVGDGSSG
jgi:hypothetical protein